MFIVYCLLFVVLLFTERLDETEDEVYSPGDERSMRKKNFYTACSNTNKKMSPKTKKKMSIGSGDHHKSLVAASLNQVWLIPSTEEQCQKKFTFWDFKTIDEAIYFILKKPKSVWPVISLWDMLKKSNGAVVKRYRFNKIHLYTVWLMQLNLGVPVARIYPEKYIDPNKPYEWKNISTVQYSHDWLYYHSILRNVNVWEYYSPSMFVIY